MQCGMKQLPVPLAACLYTDNEAPHKLENQPGDATLPAEMGWTAQIDEYPFRLD